VEGWPCVHPLAEVANPGGGNRDHVDPGDVTLNLLADILGPVEVVAIGPVDSPLPVKGRCSRCDTPTTAYGPRGRPICDRCREDGESPLAKDAEPVLGASATRITRHYPTLTELEGQRPGPGAFTMPVATPGTAGR
jgi:hypothetical protein